MSAHHEDRLLPNDWTSLVRTSRRLIARGQSSAALPLLAQAIQLRPGDLPTRLIRAAALFRSGNASASLAAFDAALADHPEHPAAHHGRGLSLTACGDRDAALQAFRLAVHFDPLSWQSWRSIADLTHDEPERVAAIGKAADALSLLCRRSSADPALVRTCTSALICAGRADEAARFAARNLARFQNPAAACECLARTCYAAGDFSNAALFAGAALSASPAWDMPAPAAGKSLDPGRAVEALREITGLLASRGLTGFLAGGTLLGFVRNGAPLAHDRDIDIGVLCPAGRRPDIAGILRAHPGLMLKHSARAGDRYFGVTFQGIAVDIFLYEVKEHACFCGFSDRRGDIEWRFSRFGLEEAVWDGIPWMVPSACRLYLAETYGAQWQTPDKGFASVLSSPALYGTDPNARAFYAWIRAAACLGAGDRRKALRLIGQAPFAMPTRQAPGFERELEMRLTQLGAQETAEKGDRQAP